MIVQVIGMGRIGLSIASLLATNGVEVYGYDIIDYSADPETLISRYRDEPMLSVMIVNCVANNHIRFAARIQKADYYLLTINTISLDCRISDVEIYPLLDKLAEEIEAGSQIILISTVTPGSCLKIKEYIYKKRPDLIDYISIVYSPERGNPGEMINDMVYMDRLLGSDDQIGFIKAKKIFSCFVKAKLHYTTIVEAEIIKIFENVYRDCCIAVSNHLFMMLDDYDVNRWRLMDLANTNKRVNIMRTGVGVGGVCISAASNAMISYDRKNTVLLKAVRDVNDKKTEWCIKKITTYIELYIKENKSIPKVAFMGMTYKPNVSEIKNSSAMKIIERIRCMYDMDIYCADPYLQTFEYAGFVDIAYAVRESDVIIYLVAHKVFENIEIDKSKHVIDLVGACADKYVMEGDDNLIYKVSDENTKLLSIN
jgi:UDP-N-acetyl-D-mannosaminuronic acid dehydrogenase